MKVLTPRTVGEARAMRADGGMYAAGLTAVALASGRTPSPGLVVDLMGLPDLSGIEVAGDVVRIGSMTRLETIRNSPLVAACAPALAELLAVVASVAIRNVATIGGNIGWGEGDLIPALIAHGAQIERDGERSPIECAPEGGLIEAVILPARRPDWSYGEKVGFRAAFSPSVVTVAAAARIEAGRLTNPVLAIGGGSTRAQRLAPAEAFVDGRAPDDIDAGELRAIVRAQAQCGEGGGLSAAHRARVAANVLTHAIMEARA